MFSTRFLSKAYRRPSVSFAATADDGIALAGSRVGVNGPSLIFCHGFLGWHRKPRVVAFVEQMAQWFAVYAFDFRGHGASGGSSTYGDLEYLDVDAVVRLAREERGGHPSVAMRRLRRITSTRSGRRIARLAGYRLADSWSEPEAPEDVVDRIAPIPLILVHGSDDHFFDVEEAYRLYQRATEPKRLMLSSRFGHAEDGLTPAFAERVTRRIHEALGMTISA